jgi:hypothetical protein
MAKKQKFATETNDSHTEGVATEGVAVNLDAPKAPLIPRNPSLFLQNAEGVQYKFDRRNNLPKKAPVAGELIIDGQNCPFQITSNKGWAKDESLVLEYIWVTLPNGVSGFITGDYTQELATFAGAEFTTGEGAANRKNPDRVGDDAKEQARKAAAAATLAAKKAAAPVETPAEEQPTE